LLLIGGGVAGWRWYSTQSKNDAPEFRTATVSKGDITQEVTANGALSPVKNVEVGSQVSGIIEKLYVDFNSMVKEGDMLVKIDPSTFEQNLRQSEAELDNAQASLELAQVNYRRAKELFKGNLISASEHDTTFASLHQAEANVKIRQANVERAKVDVARTKITAPIDGVVISRNVDEGQTVAARLLGYEASSLAASPSCRPSSATRLAAGWRPASRSRIWPGPTRSAAGPSPDWRNAPSGPCQCAHGPGHSA
jgi:HlyD family secretion protein